MQENIPHFILLPNRPWLELERIGLTVSDRRELLPTYFALRAEVYNAFGMMYYTTEPTEHDILPDTIFILVMQGEQVVGGARVLQHLAFSNARLHTQDAMEKTLEQSMPHLDIETMHYAELGGLFLQQEVRKIPNLSHALHEQLFLIVKALNMDFAVAEVVPTNLTRFMNVAEKMGVQQLVPRPDIRSTDGDEDFRTFVSFKSEQDLPLLSPEQKMQGIGKPLPRSISIISSRIATVFSKKIKGENNMAFTRKIQHAEGLNIFLVYGQDRGVPCYHYVQVDENKISHFLKQKQQVNLEMYGKIVESGYGEPSQAVRKKMEAEYGFIEA